MAADLTVFQRTPAMALPMGQRPLTPNGAGSTRSRGSRSSSPVAGSGGAGSATWRLARSAHCRSSEDGTPGRLRRSVGGRRPALLGRDVHRHHPRRGRQPHRIRVLAGEDPAAHRRPARWRSCSPRRNRRTPSGPSARRSSRGTTRRSTSRTCTWSTSAPRPSSGSSRPECAPRPAITTSTCWYWRPASTPTPAACCVSTYATRDGRSLRERWARGGRHPSRRRHPRLAEPAHALRAAEPDRVLERPDLRRGAGRLDHRTARPPPSTRRRHHRSHGGCGPGLDGGARSVTARRPCWAEPTPGTWPPTSRASGASCSTTPSTDQYRQRLTDCAANDYAGFEISPS